MVWLCLHLLLKSPGQVEHILVVPGPDDSRLAKSSAEDQIIPGQRDGMQSHRFITRIGAARLEDHDGLLITSC